MCPLFCHLAGKGGAGVTAPSRAQAGADLNGRSAILCPTLMGPWGAALRMRQGRMKTAMSDGVGGTSTWPADIIHVNEDGWVLINRGRAHGVLPGLRLLVVGSGIRELRDLFPAATREVAGDATSQPPAPALRTRRTYEQLDVVSNEDAFAVAVATRTPPERRPEFYRGLEGELLVWVPLPAGFTWPQPGADEHDLPPDAVANGDTGDRQEESWDEDDTADTAGEDEGDTPPALAEQDDEGW